MKYAQFVSVIGMVFLAVAVTIGSAQAAVEDVLLEKGIITKEDWLKIKAEKEQEKEQAKEQAKEQVKQEAKEQKEQAVEIIPPKETPSTRELITGSGYDKIRFKNVDLSPGGFVEATGLWRSANENADVGSTYGNIPLSGTANDKLSEFRGTARQSRLSLLVESRDLPTKLSGYVETDFLGVSANSNENESNSWALRLRQFWATAKFTSNTSVTAGQAWSLLTTNRKGISPQAEWVPYTIDAQYNVGYNWARQFQVRTTQDFGNGIWAAFSIENPETLVPTDGQFGNNNVNLPANLQGFQNSINNNNGPNSLLNGAKTSTDIAPDLVAKVAFEPGWGHYEIKAIGRFFRDRLAGNNNNAFGGGVGAAAILPIHPTLDLIVEGLSGAGIGRYGSAQGPDVVARPDGKIVPVQSTQFLTALEWHPTPAWDIYTYYGWEYWNKTAFKGTNIGYGSPLDNLSGCNADSSIGGPAAGTCQSSNKDVWQIQPGFWYRFMQGKAGIAAVGVSYSYVHRQLWSGQNGAAASSPQIEPSGAENIVMTSFRYYLP